MLSQISKALAASILVLLTFAGGAQASERCSFQVLDEPASLEQMINSRSWRADGSNISPGYLRDPLWIRCSVSASKPYFSVQNPVQKAFEVHFVDAENRHIKTVSSGRLRGFEDHAMVAADFVFKLPPDTAWIYIQDDSAGPKNYPLRFQDGVALAKSTAAAATVQGIYYALFLLIIVISATIAYVMRQVIYGCIFAYALSMLAYLANRDGFGRQYLWSGWSDFLEYWPIITLVLTVICFSQFSIRFLRAQAYFPKHTQILNIAQALIIANVVARMGTDHYLTLLLEPYLLVGVCLLFVALGIRSALQGSRAGRIFLAGIACVFAGAIIDASTLMGHLDMNQWTRQAVHAGALLEILIFSSVLAIVARRSHRADLEAKHQALELSRQVRELRSAKEIAEEHRQLQRTLHNAQKQRTLGQMAGGIGHEFNNILASIVGFTELAQQRIGSTIEQSRYLEEILKAGNRASDLVRQLLLYSRGSAGQVKEVDVEETVAEAYNLLRSSLPPSITINLNVDRDHPPAQRLFIDPQSIQQLLVNVCLNATEAMSDQGIVEIVVRSKQVSERLCSSCLERFSGSYTAIEISDNGPGISGNVQEVFQPFHTTKNVGAGSGLGLSVVHGIVHECNGHVQAANRARGGFRVALYLADMPAETRQRSNARVLLVESNASVSDYLTILLDGQAYDVTTTRHATDALEHFVSDPGSYDLVITDESLPHGSGLDLAQDLLALRPDLPIIMTTQGLQHDKDLKAREAGIRAVFSKPIEADRLVARVGALLDSTPKNA